MSELNSYKQNRGTGRFRCSFSSKLKFEVSQPMLRTLSVTRVQNNIEKCKLEQRELAYVGKMVDNNEDEGNQPGI